VKYYRIEIKINKIIFTSLFAASLYSCKRPEIKFPSAELIDAAESTSTEKVISGSFEISVTTEEIVEKSVSGSVTIEGVAND
jgi:hypothetical protein